MSVNNGNRCRHLQLRLDDRAPSDNTVAPGPPAWQRRLLVEWMDGRTAELTPKEWEVLVLRHAYATAEIAQRVVIATVTVRTDIAVLVRKLRVRGRAVLAGPPKIPGR